MALTGTAALVAPLIGRDTGLADAGATFVATMATTGAGLVGFATPTTFAIGKLNPFITMYNGGNLNIYPLYVRLRVTVVPTTNTTSNLAITLDQGNLITTPGTAMTINNTNIGSQLAVGNPNAVNPSALKSGAQVNAGINVVTASSQNRVIGNYFLRPVVNVVHDQYTLSFGSPDPTSTGMPIEGTLVVDRVFNVPGCVVGPGQLMNVIFWATGITVGITMEAEVCYGER